MKTIKHPFICILLLIAGSLMAADPKQEAKQAEFAKQWNAVIQDAKLDDFLTLRTNEFGKTPFGSWPKVAEGGETVRTNVNNFYARNSESFFAYSMKKAEPWIVCIDYEAPSYSVVAGGYVNAGVCPIFQLPAGAGEQKTAVTINGISPDWEYFEAFAFKGSGAWAAVTGVWMASWKNDLGATVSGTIGWIVKRWWVHVPVKQPVGPVKTTLKVTATGPWGEAKSEAKENNEEFTLRVVPEPTPTQEQMFALWGSAIILGDSLLDNSKDEKERNSYRPALGWLNEILRRFEASGKKETGELAKAMRQHPSYKKFVLDNLPMNTK